MSAGLAKIAQLRLTPGGPLGNVAKHAATLATSTKTGRDLPKLNGGKVGPPVGDRRGEPPSDEERAEARARACKGRFDLQEQAAMLAPHERVYQCCRYLQKNETHVELKYSASEGRAHFGSLVVCGSVWLCPVCAARVAEERRRELAQAIKAVDEQGGQILHVTYTVQHSMGDKLDALLQKFTRAYRSLTPHRSYKVLRKEYEIFGSVRALEVTNGENGWHPHYHVLLFLSRPLTDKQLVDLECELRNCWYGAAKRSGLSMNAHGLRLAATKGAIGDYVAKYGHDPRGDKPLWGPESELSKAHVKASKGVGGATPWDLLRLAAVGDTRSARKWQEYAEVFKGRQQLVWSPHLRALLGLEDPKSDVEAAEALPDDAKCLTFIPFYEWMLVLRYRVRGELLNVASSGDVVQVRAFIDGLAVKRLSERRRRGLEPPAPPPAVPAPQQLRLRAIA